MPFDKTQDLIYCEDVKLDVAVILPHSYGKHAFLSWSSHNLKASDGTIQIEFIAMSKAFPAVATEWSVLNQVSKREV